MPRTLDEGVRTLTAAAVSAIGTTALSLLRPDPNDNTWLTQLASWNFFAGAWLVFTAVAFSRRTPEQLRSWAHREDSRPGGWRSMVDGRAAHSAIWLVAIGGVYALVAAAFVLPRAEELSPDDSGFLSVMAALAVALAWLTSQTAYTLHYIRLDTRNPGALAFPGMEDGRPRLADYAYFAFGVGTTFGTTDVEVRSTRLRRTVTLQNVYSFAFNTAVLAIAVAALAG